MAFLGASSLSRVRYPRAWLSLGGAMLPCLTATVTRKSERSSDTFSAELSVDETAAAGYGYAEWADYQPVDVEVLMSLDGTDPVSVITGRVDEPKIDWDGCTVSVSGRDKGATLTEKRRSQQFKNRKSGDIVSTIAQDHGLNAAVTAGQDFAGKIYDQDTVHHVLNFSDHEILSRLAGREGFRWYVDGSDLVFEPKGTDANTYDVQWVPPDGQGRVGVATCTTLTTTRNMTAAKPHTMAVRSWHHKDAKHYDGMAQAGGIGSDTVAVEHHHNGRNQAQVDKIAASRLKDAIRHDCSVTVGAPTDLSVTPRMKLNLSGTGTIFDQLYDVDSVTITTSRNGSEMTVEGKIAKSGRSGTDDTGSTRNTAPLPPPRPSGIGNSPVTTPVGSGGIGSA